MDEIKYENMLTVPEFLDRIARNVEAYVILGYNPTSIIIEEPIYKIMDRMVRDECYYKPGVDLSSIIESRHNVEVHVRKYISQDNRPIESWIEVFEDPRKV